MALAQTLPRAQRVDAAAIASSPGWVLALTSLASFMVSLDALVVTTALSTIRVELGASIEALQWTVNAYNVSFAVLLLTGAALGDRFGRRRMFALGLSLFTAASVACALSPSVEALIVARAVQGAGGALVMPLALALLTAAFAPEERARALGLFSGLTGLAILVGPVIGGAIVQSGSWHWIFWLNVPVGILTVVLALGRTRESFGPRAALDFVGLALAGGASLAAVWGLARANAVGWQSLETVGALMVAAVLTVAFVAYENRTPAPMIPMRLFRVRDFSAACAASFLFTGALYGTLFFVAQFLQTGQGYGPLQAGLRLLPWTCTLFLVAPLAGRLVNHFGERPLIVVGLVLQAIGMAWVSRVISPEVGFLQIAVPFVVAGAGVSMAMPAAQHTIVRSVAMLEIGKASGVSSMLRFLGGAFGITVSATAFAARGGFGTSGQFSDGFTAALTLCAVLSLLGAGAGLLVSPKGATSA